MQVIEKGLIFMWNVEKLQVLFCYYYILVGKYNILKKVEKGSYDWKHTSNFEHWNG